MRTPSNGPWWIFGVTAIVTIWSASVFAQTNRATVNLHLEGVNQRPLNISLSKDSTGVGLEPITVRVTGGRRPYQVSAGSAYRVDRVNDAEFRVSRVQNGFGSSTITVRDAAGNSAGKGIRGVLTGVRPRGSASGAQAQPAAATGGSTGNTSRVHLHLEGVRPRN